MSFFTPHNDVISYKLDVTLKTTYDAMEVSHSHPTQENSHVTKEGLSLVQHSTLGRILVSKR